MLNMTVNRSANLNDVFCFKVQASMSPENLFCSCYIVLCPLYLDAFFPDNNYLNVKILLKISTFYSFVKGQQNVLQTIQLINKETIKPNVLCTTKVLIDVVAILKLDIAGICRDRYFRFIDHKNLSIYNFCIFVTFSSRVSC